MEGKVARMMGDKGFGFIRANNTDYFFHSSQCNTPFNELREQDDVEFEVEKSPKGPRAINVEKV